MKQPLQFRIWDNANEIFTIYDFSDIEEVEIQIGCLHNHYSPYYLLDNPKLLQIFTGLKDKNGKEIYEGDVVRFDNSIMCVQWCERGWFEFYQPSFREHHNLSEQAEVIGNIYENPELLEKGQ